MQQQNAPIDAIVSTLAHGTTQAGAGWVLGMIADLESQSGVRQHRIEFKPVLPDVDDWEPPVDWRKHQFHDPASIVEYAKKYGGADKSIVFWNKDTISLVLDEGVAKGEREVLTCPWTYAPDFITWQSLLGKPTPYSLLRKQLPALAHTLDDIGLLVALRDIRYSEETKYDSTVKEDGASYGVVFTVNGTGDTLKQIPKDFKVRVPILDIDVVNPAQYAVLTVKVHLQMPEESGDPLNIVLVSPEFEQTRRLRLANEVARLTSALDGWLVVNGVHQEEPRKFGNKERFIPIKPPAFNVVPVPGSGSGQGRY